MIESYLMGLVTGFFIGVAVIAVPEKIKKLRRVDYIDIRLKERR
jgi:hypothetical protein